MQPRLLVHLHWERKNPSQLLFSSPRSIKRLFVNYVKLSDSVACAVG